MSIAFPSQAADALSATHAKALVAKAQALAARADTSSAGTSTAGTNNITSSDFLALLVTEMKNQDPTQPTDPTQYVSQLVGVNSLQQLISINQELGGS